MTLRVSKHCPDCGSKDIDYLADIKWSEENQAEEVDQCDDYRCHNCGAERITPEERPLTTEYRACEACGCQQVKLDAWAEWNEFTNQWVLEGTYDHAFCPECDGECTVIDVVVES